MRLATTLFFIVFAATVPLLSSDVYYRDLLVLTGIFALLTLSLDIIYSGMGQFSFVALS